MSRDSLEQSQNPDSSRGIDNSSVGKGLSSKRSRSLLRVPSRSSSKKNQPSPTTSGLSGVTASESRDSIGDRSRGSKASIMGRRRNGSASSNRSAVDANQTATANALNAPAQQKKKKGGLLSLLCCVAPDDANAVDNEPADGPGHKVEKLPPRPTTSSRRPTPSDNNSSKATQLQEKDALSGNPSDPPKAKRESAITTQDQSTLADEPKTNTLRTAPTVTIDPPLQENSAPGPSGVPAPPKDEDGDTEMPDALEKATEPAVQPVEVGDLSGLPPAPPLPAVPSPPQDALVSAPDQPQQEWLLPPIQPQFKGRKCLVLDLDETLVHSSFKVRLPCSVVCKLRLLTSSRYFTKPTSPFRLKSRATIITYM